jgi:hypothetical protein
MDPILKRSLDWYVFLARQPGWKAQAWHSANELAKEHPQFFWNLPAMLTKEMQSNERNKDRPDGAAQEAAS